MAKYISLVKYTGKGVENIKESPSRLDAFKQLCESLGVTLDGFYLTMGRYDIMIIGTWNLFQRRTKMKLNLKALTTSMAIVWGGAVLIVGVANVIWPGYGKAFLTTLASIYPGFAASGTFGDAIAGSLYALFDAAVVTLIFGWLYNLIAGAESS